MTSFYRFNDQGSFLAAGGRAESEYTQDGIAVSVIGPIFEDEPDPIPEDYEPVLLEFLVNTSRPVEAWEEFAVSPTNPMRIFG